MEPIFFSHWAAIHLGTSLIPDRLQSSPASSPRTNRTLLRRDAPILAAQLDELLRPDERFVLRAAGGRITVESVRAADWPAVVETAARLGMLGHLAMRAEDLRHCGAPEDRVARFLEAARGQAAFNLLLAHTETELLDKLASHGISTIPVKGVSLSRILYGNPAVRSTTDIDLLVSAAQISAATEMLENCGYRSRLPRALLLRRAFLESTDEHTGESVYVAEAGGIPLQVELHWKILPLPEETLWGELTEYAAAGGPVQGLSPELYLLYLSAHLAGHGWRSLHWLVDIAAFLEKFADGMDGAKFLELCSRAKLRQRTGVTLVLLREYFGIEWPAAKALDTPGPRRAAASVLRRPLEPASTPGVFEVHRERLRLQDNAAGRLRYLWRLAYPTREEWAREDGTLRPAAAAWATRAARLLRLAGAEAAASVRTKNDESARASSTANSSSPDPARPHPDPGEAA